MSVTITINNNIQYCNENNLFTPDSIECCNDKECPSCKGKGTYTFNQYPFELNVSNTNFDVLWSALNLHSEPDGEMYPQRLKIALKSFDPALLVRDTVKEKGHHQPSIIHCGIDAERARYYYEKLMIIAEEAMKREELINWS